MLFVGARQGTVGAGEKKPSDSLENVGAIISRVSMGVKRGVCSIGR